MLQEGTESNGRILGGTRFSTKTKGKKRKDTESEYVSSSTVDRPPRIDEAEEKVKQGALFDDQTLTERFNSENEQMDRMFAVELTLKLKPKNGKAVTIPVLNEEIRASIVPEAIALSMDARRYKSVLKAVLDVPDAE